MISGVLTPNDEGVNMPSIRIWIYLIWATKNRYPFLKKEIRPTIFKHIRENAHSKGIFLDFINGYVEHVHTLISLKGSQSISKVAQALKGESSNWINSNQLTPTKFGWQDEYIAISISDSAVNKVREYIKNQEEHHRVKSFAEEYQWFMNKYGFEIISRD